VAPWSGDGELSKLLDELVTEAAEEGKRKHRTAEDLSREIAKDEWCAAEATELIAEGLVGEGVLLGLGARLVGCQFAVEIGFGRGADCYWFTDGGVDGEIDRSAALGIGGGESFAEARY